MLEQFLTSSKLELQQEYLTLKVDDAEYKTKAFALAQRINDLGTIIELPKIVLALKEEFDKIENQKKQMAEIGLDPLNKE